MVDFRTMQPKLDASTPRKKEPYDKALLDRYINAFSLSGFRTIDPYTGEVLEKRHYFSEESKQMIAKLPEFYDLISAYATKNKKSPNKFFGHESYALRYGNKTYEVGPVDGNPDDIEFTTSTLTRYAFYDENQTINLEDVVISYKNGELKTYLEWRRAEHELDRVFNELPPHLTGKGK